VTRSRVVTPSHANNVQRVIRHRKRLRPSRRRHRPPHGTYERDDDDDDDDARIGIGRDTRVWGFRVFTTTPMSVDSTADARDARDDARWTDGRYFVVFVRTGETDARDVGASASGTFLRCG